MVPILSKRRTTQVPWRLDRLGFFILLNVSPMLQHNLHQYLQALFKQSRLPMLPLALHFAWSLVLIILLIQRLLQGSAVPSACNLHQQETE